MWTFHPSKQDTFIHEKKLNGFPFLSLLGVPRDSFRLATAEARKRASSSRTTSATCGTPSTPLAPGERVGGGGAYAHDVDYFPCGFCWW